MGIIDKIKSKNKGVADEIEEKKEKKDVVVAPSMQSDAEDSDIDILDYETFLRLQYEYDKTKNDEVKKEALALDDGIHTKKVFYVPKVIDIDIIFLVISAKDIEEISENLDFAIENLIKVRKVMINLYISSTKLYKAKSFIFKGESDIEGLKNSISNFEDIEFTSENSKKYSFDSIISSLAEQLDKLKLAGDEIKLKENEIYKIREKKIAFIGSFRVKGKTAKKITSESDIAKIREKAEITCYVKEEDLSVMLANYSIRNIYLIDRPVIEGVE